MNDDPWTMIDDDSDRWFLRILPSIKKDYLRV